MSDTLISPEARAAIGQTFEEGRGIVYKKEFQRWAASVGDLNPLYFDEVFAKSNGHPDVVMPPMFLADQAHQIMTGVTFLNELRPDGLPVRRGLNIPLPERRLAGGEEIHFYRHVYPGDELTVTRKLSNVEQKQGKSGALVLLTWQTSISNERGEVVAEVISTSIAR